MNYNVKNYTEQGGDVTHFGGQVVFEDGCQIDGLPSSPIPVASNSTLGGVKVGAGLSISENGVLSAPGPDIPSAAPEVKGLVYQGAAVSDASETVTASDFNALLASLRTAGILSSV